MTGGAAALALAIGGRDGYLPGMTDRADKPLVSIARPSRARARGSARDRFGGVTLTGAKPTADAVRANVAASTSALERAGRRLLKPGVVIRPRKDVPRFFVAEEEPDVFIRQLNGRIERGRSVNGSFKVID